MTSSHALHLAATAAVVPSGGVQWPLLFMFVGLATAGGLGMYLGIASVLEYVYYRRRRAQAHEWKCQPRRWLTPVMQRRQILLGSANMAAGSVVSGLFVYHVATGGYSTLYFDWRERGLVFTAVTTVVYVLAIECALYWAHRTYHRPALFRAIHRVHHKFTSPTAFTMAAMHPIEWATYQAIAMIPMFVLPVYAYSVIAVLLYTNYVALVDHSGVKLYSWLPVQPPSQFHDDHHLYFHVNYGQTFGVWDRVFGTWRRHGRRYGESVFGGKGAPLAAPTSASGPVSVSLKEAPLVDYRREALERPAPEASVDPDLTLERQP